MNFGFLEPHSSKIVLKPFMITYAQEARFDWGWYSFAEKNEKPVLMEMVVARGEVDYLLPITEGGCFYDVTLWVDSIGTSSFVNGYELTKDELDVLYPEFLNFADLHKEVGDEGIHQLMEECRINFSKLQL